MRFHGTCLLTAATLAACGGSSDRSAASRGADSSTATLPMPSVPSAQKIAEHAGLTTNAPVNAPGAVVIHTTDGAVTLALANDTVSMGLSDSVLSKARTDMAKDKDTSGVGGAFSNFIKKTVSSALRSRIAYPVEDIAKATYENGAIRFDYATKRQMTFESVSTDNRKALASFSPADAQRFVAAVDSAIVARKAGR